ncbi:hypothetical protein LEP1GSC060_0467 [Leptospira weilii serovar Ranarum str. ICFT]|uniref:Uncharacterized protein n=1 Tax=Leptospira weilii serovar Ranarum str. ICFT TaxID=1218598 RepID=N1WRH3_9LEPT|nr:hypothetical protein LEP1GSC060_0467 [Leptospira weilii serovar Ranarum str. ICFT]
MTKPTSNKLGGVEFSGKLISFSFSKFTRIIKTFGFDGDIKK